MRDFHLMRHGMTKNWTEKKHARICTHANRNPEANPGGSIVITRTRRMTFISAFIVLISIRSHDSCHMEEKESDPLQEAHKMIALPLQVLQAHDIFRSFLP
ncbi:hypothetical protein ACFX2B_040797 [Malus domestica]